MEEQDSRMIALGSKVVGWWKWRTMQLMFDKWLSSVHEKEEAVPAEGPPVAVASRKIAATRAAAPQTPSVGSVALSLPNVPLLPDNVPILTDYGSSAVFVAAEAGGAGEKRPVAATQNGADARSAKPSPAGAVAGSVDAVYSVPVAVRRMQVSLDVVGCPSAAVLGRNRIYLPTAVFATFSQFQAAQLGSSILPSTAEPVLIAVNGTAFEAWAAPDLAPSAIALDSVQAISVSTSIGERVRVWPLDLSSGLCNVTFGFLSVRLKDKSSHLGLNGLDKNRFSEHCFQVLQGHPLSPGQRLLIGYGYWRMEVSVDHLDDPWSDFLLAFHEGKHGRLGARTWVSRLPPKVLVLVSQLFWQDACVNTVLSVSSKLIYNFWDGANYEGYRSAECVAGGGREHVLIRGETLGPHALNIAALGASASPQEKRPSSVPLTFSPAPFSTTLGPQPIPTTIGPGTAFSLFSLAFPSSPSSRGTSEGTAFGTSPKAGYSPNPDNLTDGAASQSPVVGYAIDLYGSYGPSGTSPKAGYSPNPAKKHVAASQSPTVGYVGSYSRMLQPMQLGPVFPNLTARASGVPGAQSAGDVARIGGLEVDTVDSRHRITFPRAGTQKSKSDAILSDMLMNASLEHKETLLQLDEMSTLAGASLQREQKFVETIKAVVSRNQTKGGDWSYLATVLRDYSEEVLASLRTIEKQSQRQAQQNSHSYNRPGDRVPVSNRTPTLDTVEEGKEDPSTSRSHELEYGREEARIRANEAQRIRDMALSVPKDQQKKMASLLASSLSSLDGGLSSSPALSGERGEMSSPQLGATGNTGGAGGSVSAVPSGKEDQLPSMQTASNASSGKPGNSQKSMEREALRAQRAKELKEAIQSSASSPTALRSNRNDDPAPTQPKSSPAPASTQGNPQISGDAKDAAKRNPRVILTVVSAEHLPSMDFMGKCDGLVEINWEGQRFKTNPKKQSYDPVWNEDFEFKFDYEGVNAHGVGDMILSLKDWDVTAVTGYEHIGQAVLPASRLNTFLITGQDRASFTEVGLAVQDKMGAQVIGKDMQPCTLRVKLQLFLDPVPPTDETSKKTGGWFGGMFGGGAAVPDTGSQGDGGKDLLPSITKAKVAVSRSAAPPPRVAAPEFNGSQTGLSAHEKRLLDQQDDELKSALDSGTLPSPVKVLYILSLDHAIFCCCRVVLATASDVYVIHSQNAIKEAQRRRDTPMESSLNSVLAPPAVSTRKKLDSPFFTGLGQNINSSPPINSSRNNDGISLFGRPSAAQLLQGSLGDGEGLGGAPRTLAGTRGREAQGPDEIPVTLLANPTLTDKSNQGASLSAVVGRNSQEEEESLKANAVNGVAESDPGLRRTLSSESSTSSIAVAHAKRADSSCIEAIGAVIKEELKIGGGAGSLFGRPSPAQLLALANN